MRPSFNRLHVTALFTLVALVARPAHADGEPPWIGIELGKGPTGGVLVKRVVEDAPGDKAHLKAGDEVVSVDGQKVTAPEQLSHAVLAKAAGDVVRLKLAGPGARERVVKLEARPDPLDFQKHALEGKAAPDFMAMVKSGPKLGKLSALKGRVVLIDFFATWCGPCMEALPRVQALHHELAARGLTVIGISGEAPNVVGGVAARGIDYSLVADAGEEVSGRYHVSALPTMVVIDRAGVVRLVSVADEDEAERMVRSLLAGK